MCARPTSPLAVVLCPTRSAHLALQPPPQGRQTHLRCAFRTGGCSGCPRLPRKLPLQTPAPSQAQPGSMCRASGRSSQRPALQLRRVLQQTPCLLTSLRVSSLRICLFIIIPDSFAHCLADWLNGLFDVHTTTWPHSAAKGYGRGIQAPAERCLQHHGGAGEHTHHNVL